ncbi:MAG: hypothetical protein JWR75_392 [Devosia sp.]|nr:hypothetical protein [Devosia sp.]
MSEISSLTELVNIVGDRVVGERELRERRALAGSGLSHPARTQRRSVGDLLSAVLALSARTRRMVQPRAYVELDVFAPGGGRAVRIKFGER